MIRQPPSGVLLTFSNLGMWQGIIGCNKINTRNAQQLKHATTSQKGKGALVLKDTQIAIILFYFPLHKYEQQHLLSFVKVAVAPPPLFLLPSPTSIILFCSFPLSTATRSNPCLHLHSALSSFPSS